MTAPAATPRPRSHRRPSRLERLTGPVRPPRPAPRPVPAPRRPRPGRRARTPTVIQMEAVECGAAALAMVLGYHGRHVPLEELRTACGVSRDGSRAANVLKAARLYGLTSRGFQMELDGLRSVPRPSIVFWSFNHFLVLEGFGRHKVYVNDPGSGPRSVGEREFDDSYTGVVLTFEPGPEFTKGGSPPSVLAGLRERRRGNGAALVLVLLASLALVAPGIVTPAFTRAFIDRVLGGGQTGFLAPLLAGMAFVAVVTVGLTAVQQHFLLRLEAKVAISTSTRFLNRLLRLPIEFFTQRQPAEVSQRLAANDTVAEILSRDLATTAVNCVLVLFYAVLLLTYDVLLSLVGITMALLNIVVLRVVARVRSDAVAKLRADRGKLVTTTFNGLQLIETMKATGSESDFFARWAGFQAKVVTGQQRLGVPTQLLAAVPPFLATVNTGLILLIGGNRVIDGAISVGLLVAFQALLSGFTRPVTQLTQLGEKLQDVSADINRLRDVERYPLAGVFEGQGRGSRTRLRGYLDLRDVTFAYGPLSPALLTGLSLHVGPGERVALVGGSGSGKSTVGKLIAGLYLPWEGDVLFDGRPAAEIDRLTLATSVSFVDQDIFLFEGTIRDNITLWDDTVDDEAVIRALKDAELYDDVSSRPGSINSAVAEGGRNFSGGQRQRLEIARALVNDPRLLVLDEATSALDAETERRVDDNLRRRGCACVIIAHRLSTIRDADEIVVLDHGQVVERGSHDDLVRAGGAYASLISAQ